MFLPGGMWLGSLYLNLSPLHIAALSRLFSVLVFCVVVSGRLLEDCTGHYLNFTLKLFSEIGTWCLVCKRGIIVQPTGSSLGITVLFRLTRTAQQLVLLFLPVSATLVTTSSVSHFQAKARVHSTMVAEKHLVYFDHSSFWPGATACEMLMILKVLCCCCCCPIFWPRLLQDFSAFVVIWSSFCIITTPNHAKVSFFFSNLWACGHMLVVFKDKGYSVFISNIQCIGKW